MRVGRKRLGLGGKCGPRRSWTAVNVGRGLVRQDGVRAWVFLDFCRCGPQKFWIGASAGREVIGLKNLRAAKLSDDSTCGLEIPLASGVLDSKDLRAVPYRGKGSCGPRGSRTSFPAGLEGLGRRRARTTWK